MNSPIVGVISSHNVAWEFVDDEICPTCEEAYEEIEISGMDEADIDAFACTIECFDHTKLIGDWKKDADGLYEPDTEKEFAAIITSSSFNCVQVVWSKYTREVRAMCSPCFPGQADLDSGAGNILCYDLPDYLVQH